MIGVLGGHPLVLFNQSSLNESSLNQGNAGHWLTVSLHGTRSNRDGAGAIVHVNGQTQYASTAGSYLSASDKRIHFGLATSTTATVEITWPSGTRQVLKDVKSDRLIEVVEPAKP